MGLHDNRQRIIMSHMQPRTASLSHKHIRIAVLPSCTPFNSKQTIHIFCFINSVTKKRIMQTGEQQLAVLRQLLHALGLPDHVDHHILYPGYRREHLLRGLINRILGGKNMDELPLSSPAEGLAEDERFAERCRRLLKMFGLPATAEQIRGCSNNQQEDTALLLQTAQLLQAVEQQRSSAGATVTDQAGVLPRRPEPSDAAVTQLISSACANLPKLTSDVMQLFASDMNDVLKTHSDRGAAHQVHQLHKQTLCLAQQRQQQLQQLLAAGGELCEGACSEAWQQQIQGMEADLDKLIAAAQQFDETYQQELSVWAEAAHDDQHMHGLELGMGQEADSSMEVAEGVGRAARRIVAAYKGVAAALEGFGGIMKHHQSLKDVPAALLMEHKAAHHEEANRYNLAIAVLKADARS